ncbi:MULTISPECIES: DUF6883 domain-containing protein [unclassified Burkholderia]|uniref:DUF6883 domain-containing protein n=1 Tax=unclassified Burkholderia TaxID=2613784 RepID=UPI002AAF5FEA|nr:MULTISPECIES: DUF6883 domain-containing protein [unclassified Burkholderia]
MEDAKSVANMDDQSGFFAFLFNADHLIFDGENYAHASEQRFLESLARSEGAGFRRMRVRRGDVSPHRLASRATHLSIPRVSGEGKRGNLSISTTYGTDIRALKVLIGDFADSLKSGWYTVDLVDFPRQLGSTNVFCLTSYPMPLSIAQSVDAELKSFSPYIGAAELDVDNPLHLLLFKSLLDCVYFEGRDIYRSRWETDEGVCEFGTNADDYFTVSDLSYIDFQRAAPNLPRSDGLSRRGKTTSTRLASVMRPSHFEEVAQKLIALPRDIANEMEIDFEIRSSSEEQLRVPVGKLLGYSLNNEHEKGRHKARLFSDLLCIQRDHWRYLAYQLVDGLKAAELENIRLTEYGVQYSARIQVIGLNRNICTVQTGWIIRRGEPAQLTTAYPAEKHLQLKGVAVIPPFVDESVKGPDRWRAIYDLASQAGRDAAMNCTPTPMKLDGFEIELEGLCGGAYVRLDGRRAFSRWILAQGYARHGYPSGICVRADVSSQSVERAEAYANAFMRVIWLNGIDGASVVRYLS